ncbi:hypothetical protein ACKKBG_A35470 [Auxenochlorella protothecoides x Auxenochlorella symbiontica]
MLRSRAHSVGFPGLRLHISALRARPPTPRPSIVMAATALPGNPDVSTFIQGINDKYLEVHRAYEDNFWATKMALSGASTSALSSTKNALDEFLSSQDRLQAVRDAEARPDLSPEQRRVLAVLRRTFATYVSEEESVATLRARLNDLEAELAGVRNRMRLGTTDPATGEFRPASSVQLRNAMKMSGEESARRAAYDALRSIGPAIAGPFAAIVRLRNELARRAGFPNYYDMKVQAAEGFTQARLFQMLDGLESATRQLATDARARLAAAKGKDSLKPWNISNALAGDIETRMDPYFPFEVGLWLRHVVLGPSVLHPCDLQGFGHSRMPCPLFIPAFHRTRWMSGHAPLPPWASTTVAPSCAWTSATAPASTQTASATGPSRPIARWMGPGSPHRPTSPAWPLPAAWARARPRWSRCCTRAGMPRISPMWTRPAPCARRSGRPPVWPTRRTSPCCWTAWRGTPPGWRGTPEMLRGSPCPGAWCARQSRPGTPTPHSPCGQCLPCPILKRRCTTCPTTR